jgi:regulatory Fis family protein
MDAHSIVIVSLHSPKEKVWGELLVINPSGVTLRGIDLNSFDHFIRQMNEPDGERMGFPTIFFPMHRVERIALDEPSGSIPSMNELFARKLGRSLSDYLAQFDYASGKVAPRREADLSSIRFPFGTTVEAAERQLILQTLQDTGNNKTRAAELLAISLKTLHNKLKEYGAEHADGE